MFGASLSQGQGGGGSLFGGLNATQNQQQGGGLFGGQNQNNQQSKPAGGLFSGLVQSNQQNPQQGGGGFFGGLGQNAQQTPMPPSGGGSLFGGLNQATQQNQQQAGSFFGGLGQSTQQNSGMGLGQNNQQGSGLFGVTAQQQPNGLFSQSAQSQSLPQLGQAASSLWQPNSAISLRDKDVESQMFTVLDKWDTNSPNCVFKHYFYNKVEPSMAPYYRPGPNEDPKAWEEALSKKPGPGFIPVLCTGFTQMGERIQTQQRNLANFNARLHEINTALSVMLQNHDTKTSIRAMDARRKHVVLKQRCLALATRVQVLRSRGYAMDGDEENLRTKLLALDKLANDPGLNARGEEIWARMLTVQERAKLLRNEIDKSSAEAPDLLDEEMTRRAKKILEDYNVQLNHLKKELDAIHHDFVEWEKEHPSSRIKTNGGKYTHGT